MDIQQYGNLAADAVLAVTTTATRVVVLGQADLSAQLTTSYDATAQRITRRVWGYSLTNNDPTNAVYVAYRQGVSSTVYYRLLAAAGGSHQIEAASGLLNKLWIVCLAGTPSVYLAVFE